MSFHRMAVVQLWRACRFNNASFAMALVRYAFQRVCKRNLVTGPAVKIRGIRRIKILGMLKIGLSEVGFVDGSDRSYLNIRGNLTISGKFSIAQGCRIDVARGASVHLSSGYMNPFTKIIASNTVAIGEGCAISWGCQFLDDDFHRVDGVSRTSSPIVVGDRVWFGTGVTVLKGAFIPSGCIVAAGSVVCSAFKEENCLIGGVPAKVIRRGVTWL